MSPDWPIHRAFGPADLEPLMAVAGIVGSVLVQTRASVDETREFLATTVEAPFVLGVVGWADLTAPDVGEGIARLRAGPGGDRLVGIRHQVHDEADADWLSRPDVRRGIETVGNAGLAYDLLVRTRELSAALALARERPNVRLVIDHLAKPPLATGDIDTWTTAIREFSGLDNVSAKLSGLVTEADWPSWKLDDLRPAVEGALDVFGPDRLLFGSDWPVCLLAASYTGVVSAATELTGTLTDDERAAIFGGTAAEVYGLRVP